MAFISYTVARHSCLSDSSRFSASALFLGDGIMIKVRVLRGIQSTLPLASGLLALSSSGLVTACAAPVDQQEEVGSDDSALTVSNPGTGVFELGWAYGTPTGYSFTATNSTDEYVRAGEKVSFAIPAHFLWSQLHPSESLPQDLARLKKLSAKVTMTHVRVDGSTGTSNLTTNGWKGDQLYNISATTSQVTISTRAQTVRFAIEITDAGVTPLAKKTLDAGSFFDVPVIGGAIPQKTLLFDNFNRDLRTRVLEGGNPVRGANLAIGYTDWRAATLVDSVSIDKQIGTATSYGRFGAIEMPIYGDIEYEISYGASIDNAWQGEQSLTANSKSRLVMPNGGGGSGRTAYEGTLAVPSNAQSLQMYFHVKAFLKVDYSRFQNIRWKKYGDNQRLLVRERWDNEHGATNDNYDFTTESK
jgi:hypothetical protein